MQAPLSDEVNARSLYSTRRSAGADAAAADHAVADLLLRALGGRTLRRRRGRAPQEIHDAPAETLLLLGWRGRGRSGRDRRRRGGRGLTRGGRRRRPGGVAGRRPRARGVGPERGDVLHEQVRLHARVPGALAPRRPGAAGGEDLLEWMTAARGDAV